VDPNSFFGVFSGELEGAAGASAAGLEGVEVTLFEGLVAGVGAAVALLAFSAAIRSAMDVGFFGVSSTAAAGATTGAGVGVGAGAGFSSAVRCSFIAAILCDIVNVLPADELFPSSLLVDLFAGISTFSIFGFTGTLSTAFGDFVEFAPSLFAAAFACAIFSATLVPFV
jgi:hypothetical protein